MSQDVVSAEPFGGQKLATSGLRKRTEFIYRTWKPIRIYCGRNSQKMPAPINAPALKLAALKAMTGRSVPDVST